MDFPYVEKYKSYPIIIRGHPKGTHTHSWIHYRFFRAFERLGYTVQWLDNKKENLPDKNKEYIIITAHNASNVILENYSDNRIVFDHNLPYGEYHYYKGKKILPFGVLLYNSESFTESFPRYTKYDKFDIPHRSSEELYYYKSHPKILWGSELLPHEILWKPYHYIDTCDVVFIGSRRHNNRKQLESLRLYCITHKLHYKHLGRHLLLRPPFCKKWYVSPEEMNSLTYESYIAPAVQGYQINIGYIPCRLFMNMSLSVLGVSNNPYIYNLFDQDEVIMDKNIWHMMEKAERIIKDRQVDNYTRKAIKKIQEKHTYINRIDELFSYL